MAEGLHQGRFVEARDEVAVGAGNQDLALLHGLFGLRDGLQAEGPVGVVQLCEVILFGDDLVEGGPMGGREIRGGFTCWILYYSSMCYNLLQLIHFK